MCVAGAAVYAKGGTEETVSGDRSEHDDLRMRGLDDIRVGAMNLAAIRMNGGKPLPPSNRPSYPPREVIRMRDIPALLTYLREVAVWLKELGL